MEVWRTSWLYLDFLRNLKQFVFKDTFMWHILLSSQSLCYNFIYTVAAFYLIRGWKQPQEPVLTLCLYHVRNTKCWGHWLLSWYGLVEQTPVWNGIFRDAQTVVLSVRMNYRPGTKMGKLWTVGVDGCASKTLIKDTHRLGEQRRDLKFFRKAHSLPLNPTSLLHICILL